MILKPETVGFTRGGMLFLEPPTRWRVWQRNVWTCCSPSLASSHAAVLSSPREGENPSACPRSPTSAQDHT